MDHNVEPPLRTPCIRYWNSLRYRIQSRICTYNYPEEDYMQYLSVSTLCTSICRVLEQPTILHTTTDHLRTTIHKNNMYRVLEQPVRYHHIPKSVTLMWRCSSCSRRTSSISAKLMPAVKRDGPSPPPPPPGEAPEEPLATTGEGTAPFFCKNCTCPRERERGRGMGQGTTTHRGAFIHFPERV